MAVYFERRISSARGSDSVAADVMRHLHARQHLGKATIVCEHPSIMLSAARKQWLKLTRNAQKMRASTLNADKILKYTHTITRMQHMRFTMKTPQDYPEGDVFFNTPDVLQKIPPYCQSMYIVPRISETTTAIILGQMGHDSLVIDYDHAQPWKKLGLLPKNNLEERVSDDWKRIRTFLQTYNIKPRSLYKGSVQNIDAMDDALDTLLDVGRKFLQVAGDFQHSLEVARPLRTTKDMREQYDAVILLAHRVQALSPGNFTSRFLEIYNEDDTFYLYDSMHGAAESQTETLQMAVERHRKAGRHDLATALQKRLFQG